MSDTDNIRPGRPLTNAFGVYAHSPFCVHKCSYCDFYSFTRYGEPDFPRLLGAWKSELEDAARWLQETDGTVPKAETVFFGGGTPSLLPAEALCGCLEAISSRFGLAAGAEITLEANPETVTPERARAWRAAGFNRVSLGAQSFQPKHLASLERMGSAESIERAVDLIREAGFSDFSLDFIFAIPGQTAEELASDIRRAASLGPTHLSFYNLTLKPGHKLFGELPDDDTAADLYELSCGLLAGLGYDRYEISNFAKPGRECRHNLLYWAGGDFLGIGPSASSRFFRGGAFLHRKQIADFPLYLQGRKAMEFERTSPAQTVLEATFLELRKRWGVSLGEFESRYRYDLTRASNYARFLEDGFLSREGDRLTLTERGLMLADSVTRDLVDMDRAASI